MHDLYFFKVCVCVWGGGGGEGGYTWKHCLQNSWVSAQELCESRGGRPGLPVPIITVSVRTVSVDST